MGEWMAHDVGGPMLSGSLERLTRPPRWIWLCLLVMVAAVPRLAWIGIMAGRSPQADEVAYILHAEQLCAGRGYVTPEGEPTDFWPPGYPLALAAVLCVTNGHRSWGMGLQIVLGILVAILVWTLGRKVASEAVGRVAALVMAVYPNHVFYSSLWLGELLAAVAILLATLFLIRSPATPSAQSALGAGIFVGVAALTRPMLVPLAAVIPVWQLRYARDRATGLGGAALIVAGVLLILAPWAYRNHERFGRWSLSSSGGYNFLIGNHSEALGGFRRAPELSLRHFFFSPVGDQGYRDGWMEIKRSPLRAMVRAVQKATYFVALETDGVMWSLRGHRHAWPFGTVPLLLAVAGGAYTILVAGTLFGIVAGTSHRAFTAYFLMIAACLLATCMIFTGDPRYHFILVPLASIFLAKALVTDLPELRDQLVRDEPSARRSARRWAALVALVLLLMIANLGLKMVEFRLMPRGADLVR
jgi:hypothetical protein